MTSINQTIGGRICSVRKALGLSQTELADLIGVRFQQIQKYENGKNTVPACRLTQIASALGVSVLLLLRDEKAAVEQGEDCAELLDLFIRLPKTQRAEILFQIRAKSARLTAQALAASQAQAANTA